MAKDVQNGQNGQKRSKWPNLISYSLFHFSPFFRFFFKKRKHSLQEFLGGGRSKQFELDCNYTI